MSEKMTGKSKSMGRIIGKIALWLVIGGALGFFGAFLIFSIKGETENVMHLFFNGYLAYALWYQLGFFIVLGGIAVTLYFRAGAQIKLGNYEAEDRAGEYQNAAITANELNMVIQFLLFELAVDGKNPMMLANVVCFLVCCTVVVVMEAFLVKQVKRIQPLKRGDVGDARFTQKWLESCDEAEQMVIYKASYSSFIAMKTLLPLLEAAAFFGKLMFDTGNFPIVLICIAWGVNTGVYCFGSMRLEKGNKM